VKNNANNIVIERPFNELSLLPPAKEKIETIKVLRQVIKSSIALAELKGLVNTLPNPNILLNAVILKEARASSEIENVITTQDKLYQALSAKGIQIEKCRNGKSYLYATGQLRYYS